MEEFSDPLRQYVCTICNDQHETPEDGVPTIADHPACHQCVKALFEHSIASESNWPPTWGRQVLDPEPYERMLGEDFMRRFRDFQVEHECPANERVFCNHKSPSTGHEVCGAFLGRQQGSIIGYRCKRCKKCNAATCLRCSETFSPSSNEGGKHMATAPVSDVWVEHRCDPSAARAFRDQAFRGLRRGRHYQDCPRCRRRTELMDGCNHISCPCGESYCYICGRAVTENSDHWDRRRHGCPRYGQPGSRTAIYTDDMEGFGADDDQDIAFGSSGSSDDDDSESHYVPSEHGDMVLDEDRARWQMQILLEQQARREQRRGERTEQRIRRGRAHIRELARQRDLPVQATIGIGNESNRDTQLWETTLDFETSDDETQMVAEREPWHLRVRPVHADALGDHDSQATSEAASRSPGRLTQHNRFAHRPRDDEGRRIWQFGHNHDRDRSRGRIPQRDPHPGRRGHSSPTPLPRGSRFREYNRRMYENIALQRALAEGPSRSRETSTATGIVGRSRLHDSDPDSSQTTTHEWRRTSYRSHTTDDSGNDWAYYVERSGHFELQRLRRRCNSGNSLRDIAVAVDEGQWGRQRRAADRPETTDTEMNTGIYHDGSRRERSPRRAHSRSSGAQRRRSDEDGARVSRGWRSVPGRLWRYSQRVGGAMLNSKSKARS